MISANKLLTNPESANKAKLRTKSKLDKLGVHKSKRKKGKSPFCHRRLNYRREKSKSSQ
jgi:hypothetical protein